MKANHSYEGCYHDDSDDEVDHRRANDVRRPSEPVIKMYDAVVFDVLKVLPDEFASQLTLLDLEIFPKIQPEELSSCGWTKKDKAMLSPNVVGMTRRFNNTSFWVIHEILHARTLKSRSEIIVHFIKIAKKLHEMNSFHSLMAIVSSLNSSSICRLQRTWNLAPRNYKTTLEKLTTIISEAENRLSLRKVMENIKLPCIPYLGMYLSDLMYIDSAHPHSGGLESHERSNKMNNILRKLADFQQSDYSALEEKPHIMTYLKSVKYIEELQKFLEEDNYKLSLKIEPPNGSSTSLSPKHLASPRYPYARSPSNTPGKLIFKPGHRKSRSLGRDVTSSSIHIRPLSDPDQLHKKVIKSPSSAPSPSYTSQQNSNGSLGSSRSNSGSEFSDDLSWPSTSAVKDWYQAPCTFESYVKRKCTQRRGRKNSMVSSTKYWMGLYGTNLILFSSKTMPIRSSEKRHFKSQPSKICDVKGWLVIENNHAGSFQMCNAEQGDTYRFNCESSDISSIWIQCLKEAIKGSPQPEKDLINFHDDDT